MSGLFFYVVIGMGIFVLLFFPIFVEGDLHYDINRKKCVFSVNIYKIFRVFGGYITTYQGGLALHKNDDNAILLPYKNLDTERKKFSFIKTFQFVSFHATIESGAEYFFAVESLRRIYTFIRACLDKLKNTDVKILLVDGDTLKTSVNCVMFFNIFILLVDLIEYLWRKLKQLWREKAKKSMI